MFGSSDSVRVDTAGDIFGRREALEDLATSNSLTRQEKPRKVEKTA